MMLGWITAAVFAACLCVSATAQETVTPGIGVAQDAVSMKDNGDGTYTLAYDITLVQYGAEAWDLIKVTCAWNDATASPETFRVDTLESEVFTVNEAFDGITDTNLFAEGNRLSVGERGTVSLTVTLTPLPGAEFVSSSAIAHARSVTGEIVIDESQDGEDPDPDQDGDPTNNNQLTRVRLIEQPMLGLSKELVSKIETEDGSYNLTYALRVVNSGDVPVRDLQISDGLSVAFSTDLEFLVLSVESDELRVNPAYDGRAITDLLSESMTLPAGEAGTVIVSLRVTPAGNRGRYDNRAMATGRTPGQIVVIDLSQDGPEPDPDEDGDPTNNSEPTRLSLIDFKWGGVLKTSIVSDDSDPFTLSTVSIDSYLQIGDITASVGAQLTETTFDQLSFSLAGPIGDVGLSSTVRFDPSSLSFVSWQAGATVTLLGVSLADTVFIKSPQTSSYNQFTASGSVGGLSIQAAAKFGVCPFEFWEASTCASWPWSQCEGSLSLCGRFTDAGFTSLDVSMSGYEVFQEFYGIRGSLDITISFTPTQKILSPSFRLVPDWLICPEVALHGEVVIGSPLSIESLSIYGLTAEIPIGPVTFHVGESFAEEKNAEIIGKADYFERYGVSGELAVCCASPGSFAIDVYFRRAPAVPASLFGFGLLTASFELQIIENFGFSFDALVSPTSPFWEFTVGFQILW